MNVFFGLFCMQATSWRNSDEQLCSANTWVQSITTYADHIVSFVLGNSCSDVICPRSIYVAVIPPCLDSLWFWSGAVGTLITGLICDTLVFSSWNQPYFVTVLTDAVICATHLTRVQQTKGRVREAKVDNWLSVAMQAKHLTGLTLVTSYISSYAATHNYHEFELTVHIASPWKLPKAFLLFLRFHSFAATFSIIGVTEYCRRELREQILTGACSESGDYVKCRRPGWEFSQGIPRPQSCFAR